MNVALMDGPKDQHSENITDSYDWVRKVHTLGPAGTNCEKAALKWAALKCKKAELALHETMERAAEQVAACGCSVLLSVIAYPQLPSIIYKTTKKQPFGIYENLRSLIDSNY